MVSFPVLKQSINSLSIVPFFWLQDVPALFLPAQDSVCDKSFS